MAYAALHGCGLRRRQMIDAVVEIESKARRDVSNARQVDDDIGSFEQWPPVDRLGEVGMLYHVDIGFERRIGIRPHGDANDRPVFGQCCNGGAAQKAGGARHQNAIHVVSYSKSSPFLTVKGSKL